MPVVFAHRRHFSPLVVTQLSLWHPVDVSKYNELRHLFLKKLRQRIQKLTQLCR